MKPVYVLLAVIALVPVTALAMPVSKIQVSTCEYVTADLSNNIQNITDEECMKTLKMNDILADREHGAQAVLKTVPMR